MRTSLSHVTLIIAGLLVILPVLSSFAQEKIIITETDTILFNVHPDEEEYKILQELYKQTNGRKWKNNTNWLKGKTSQDMAKWYGVVVRDGDVSEIHLPGNNLQGIIPKSLYTLNGLLSVSFEQNNIQTEPAKQYASVNRLVSSPQPQSLSLMSASVQSTPVTAGKNLPVWGLAVQGDHVQQIDWRKTPEATELLNSGVSKLGSSGVAIDECGKLAFYVLHSGSDIPNQLHIYADDGTQLTNNTAGNPLLGLNSANGNIELQVVRVPQKADEWFIIYSLYQVPCMTNPPGSGYCPAKVVYTRVKYNQTDGLVISPENREISISDKTFIQGKAVSRTVNGDPNRHYLYLAERYNAGAFKDVTRIHRFIIDGIGINFGTQSAASINAQFWPGGIAGSSIELSPDEKKLAISNRNVGFIKEDIIIFDLDKFTSPTNAYAVISVPELVVSGTGKSINQLATEPGYACLRNIKHKLGQIEFSPSGQYLYITHGGYPPGTGGQSYNTYLLQIDLQSSAGPADPYEVRMQIQKGVNVSVTCKGPYGSLSGDNSIHQIQAAYDGKLYFTKRYSSLLYVIPNPDDPLEHSLVPDVVNLSTPASPNISMYNGANVFFMPENIDGYDYLKANVGGAADKFVLDKPAIGPGESIQLTVTNFNAADDHLIAWGDGTSQSLTTSPSVSHIYPEKGEYTITLTVLQNIAGQPENCASVTSKQLSVMDCAAMLNPAIQTKQYRCATKFWVDRKEDCFATYRWDFGDGTPTSRNRTPLHVYTPRTEPYTVSLTISYDCEECRGKIFATTQVTVSETPPALEDIVFQIPSDQRPGIISSAATTFSETWALDHNEPALDALDNFTSGSQGVWRNEGTFVYNTPRKASALSLPVDVRTDGTYTLEQFNWANSDLQAIPKWIKANSMTHYNAFGFELENKDVLDVYSAALYDYGGQLQTAHGINMHNKEMAFTGFETMGTGNPVLDDKPSGNFIFKNPAIPANTFYKVYAGKSHVAVVEASLQDLENVDEVDILLTGYLDFFLSPFSMLTRSLTGVKVLCKEEYPENPAWSVLVFERSPLDEVWTGDILIRNTIVPVVQGDIDNTVAHTGRRSLKVTSEKVFEQKLLDLESEKVYHLSAWVRVSDSGGPPATPKLANNLGIDVILKNSEGATVSTILIVPEGNVIEGWQQVKGSFTCPENNLVLSLRFKSGSTGTAWYDDVRLHPDNGNMKSYVYDITDLRLKAILDEDNFASLFYYDKEGNLHLTKKETSDGLKTITENVSYQVERQD